MKYQSNPDNTSFLADVVLGLQKDSRTVIEPGVLSSPTRAAT